MQTKALVFYDQLFYFMRAHPEHAILHRYSNDVYLDLVVVLMLVLCLGVGFYYQTKRVVYVFDLILS